MIPFKIKIESFAERCHMDTLGSKGLILVYVKDTAQQTYEQHPTNI